MPSGKMQAAADHYQAPGTTAPPRASDPCLWLSRPRESADGFAGGAGNQRSDNRGEHEHQWRSGPLPRLPANRTERPWAQPADRALSALVAVHHPTLRDSEEDCSDGPFHCISRHRACSDVLIDENCVSVGVHGDETRRAG